MSNPYEPPKTGPESNASTGDAKALARGAFVGCAGALAGFVLGGLRGCGEWQAAVEESVREGGPGDFLPVGVPIYALFGAVAGAVAAHLLAGLWWLARRVSSGDRAAS